jgi:hypothetical protein
MKTNKPHLLKCQKTMLKKCKVSILYDDQKLNYGNNPMIVCLCCRKYDIPIIKFTLHIGRNISCNDTENISTRLQKLCKKYCPEYKKVVIYCNNPNN